MSQMHTLTTRPTSGIQKERQSLLIAIQDPLKLPVAKEHSPAKEAMWAVSGQLLEPGEKLRRDPLSTELVDELVIVNCENGSIFRDSALDLPGINDLFGGACGRGGFGGSAGGGSIREAGFSHDGRLGIGGGHGDVELGIWDGNRGCFESVGQMSNPAKEMSYKVA